MHNSTVSYISRRLINLPITASINLSLSLSLYFRKSTLTRLFLLGILHEQIFRHFHNLNFSCRANCSSLYLKIFMIKVKFAVHVELNKKVFGCIRKVRYSSLLIHYGLDHLRQTKCNCSKEYQTHSFTVRTPSTPKSQLCLLKTMCENITFVCNSSARQPQTTGVKTCQIVQTQMFKCSYSIGSFN